MSSNLEGHVSEGYWGPTLWWDEAESSWVGSWNDHHWDSEMASIVAAGVNKDWVNFQNVGVADEAL